MKKELFTKITKLSHKLTKAYKKRYSCNYLIQFGIFFKLLYSMYKKNTKVEKATNVKQKINGDVKQVTYYVKGHGLDLYYTVGIGNKINPNFKSLFDNLVGKVSNIFPLLE